MISAWCLLLSFFIVQCILKNHLPKLPLSQYFGRSSYRGPSEFTILSSTRACVKKGCSSPLVINVTAINLMNITMNVTINQEADSQHVLLQPSCPKRGLASHLFVWPQFVKLWIANQILRVQIESIMIVDKLPSDFWFNSCNRELCSSFFQKYIFGGSSVPNWLTPHSFAVNVRFWPQQTNQFAIDHRDPLRVLRSIPQ